MTFLDTVSSAEKHVIDTVSVLTMVGSLANILPHVAAAFTIIWTGIRIYETETVQRLFGKEEKEDT